jgi:hypothetical protein
VVGVGEAVIDGLVAEPEDEDTWLSDGDMLELLERLEFAAAKTLSGYGSWSTGVFAVCGEINGYTR